MNTVTKVLWFTLYNSCSQKSVLLFQIPFSILIW